MNDSIEGPHYDHTCGCEMCTAARTLRDRGEMYISDDATVVHLTPIGRARMRRDSLRRHAEMRAATR